MRSGHAGRWGRTAPHRKSRSPAPIRVSGPLGVGRGSPVLPPDAPFIRNGGEIAGGAPARPVGSRAPCATPTVVRFCTRASTGRLMSTASSTLCPEEHMVPAKRRSACEQTDAHPADCANLAAAGPREGLLERHLDDAFWNPVLTLISIWEWRCTQARSRSRVDSAQLAPRTRWAAAAL